MFQVTWKCQPGRGKFYDVEFRKLLFKNYVQCGKSIDFILKYCISDPKNVSRKHIKSTCKKLDPLFAEKYLLLGGRSYNRLGVS